MPISSNAKTAADKKALKALIGSIGKTTKEDVDLNFGDDEVVITIGDRDITLERDEFQSWVDAGHPWDNGPVTTAFDAKQEETFRPQPKPASKKAAKTKPAAKAKAKPAARPAPEEDEEEPTPAPAPKKVRKAAAEEQTASALLALAAEALDIRSAEHAGGVGSNAARFRLGELMLRVQGAAKASHTPMKKMLATMNREAMILASQNALPDYEPVTEQEATMVRRVVETFGSSGGFLDVGAINPVTGQPLVNDGGDPFERDITEIAINKLYPLVSYADGADEDALNTIMSFAYRNSEKVVKMAQRVAKDLQVNVTSVIADLGGITTPMVSPLTGEEIDGPPSEKDLMSALRAMKGDTTSGEEIASLRTARSWYEGTWLPLKATVDAIAKAFIPAAVNETTGATSNVFILERILTQFYHPFTEDGIQRILGALVEAGDMTVDQANSFLNNYAWDDETNDWVLQASAVVEQATEAAVEALEEGDGEEELFEDDDLAIDSPDDAEGDAEEEDDDDDF